MRIKQTIDKLPGGWMLVPLFLGALCKTFAPNAGSYFGSFTNGMLTGFVPIIAVWFFCMGGTINFKASGTVLRKSGGLVVTKLLVAYILAVALGKVIPVEGIQSGFFTGLSVLAIVACLDMTNAGLYASLMQQYGTKEEAGAYILMSIEAGPFMTMVILGISGLGAFEPQTFVGAVLPFIAGFIIGNLDDECRDFFGKAVPVIIPFFAFSLGNGIDLSVIYHTGLLGILMGIFIIVVSGIPLILADKFIGKGDGTAGVAASSSAGQCVATPFLIAEMDPRFAEAAPAATALAATCVVVTAILVPLITVAWSKRCKGGDGRAVAATGEAS